MVSKRHNKGETLDEVKARVGSVRREQLRKLLDLEYDGSISDLTAVLDTDKKRSRASFISQVLSGNRLLGERAARCIEVELGKPSGWFDGKDPNGETTKKEAASKKRVAKLREQLGSHADGLEVFAAERKLSAHRLKLMQGVLDGSRYLSAKTAATFEEACGMQAGSISEV